ncbi:MAG: hypothetical protein HGA59_04785 [Chlorobiaceae bacterium]|nr:hypothetical protein [Chlorobiaceae bacterium]NTV15909.1 hypothetical protein [Chlorobiaceae bacterium]
MANSNYDYADDSILDSIRKVLAFFDETESMFEHHEKGLHNQSIEIYPECEDHRSRKTDLQSSKSPIRLY